MSSATRIVTFIVPVIWISQWNDFAIEDVWVLSVATVALQAALSLVLLQREFGRRLNFQVVPVAA